MKIEIKPREDGIFICQKKYVESILKKFKMKNYNIVATPLVVNEKFMKEDESGEANALLYRIIVGSLLYLTTTRSNIIFVSNLLSRFMQKLSKVHFRVAKRVLRYIKGTKYYGIMYEKSINDHVKLFEFCDSDWARSIDDMKSIFGYALFFGSDVISWVSKK